MVAAAWCMVIRGRAGAAMPGGAWCNTNSPYRPSTPTFTLATWLLMLLIHDPVFAAACLAAGTLECPRGGCGGRLRPWGHARPRRRRLSGGRYETHTPRRARCRACGQTHVLISTRSYPRRADRVETVGAALLGAAGGLGHRRVAASVDLAATTVRGWLRRARANVHDAGIRATEVQPRKSAAAWSMQRVSWATSSGSMAGNSATRNWLRPSLR